MSNKQIVSIGFKQKKDKKNTEVAVVEQQVEIPEEFFGSSEENITDSHRNLIMEVRNLSTVVLNVEISAEERKKYLDILISKVSLEAELSTLKRI